MHNGKTALQACSAALIALHVRSAVRRGPLNSTTGRAPPSFYPTLQANLGRKTQAADGLTNTRWVQA